MTAVDFRPLSSGKIASGEAALRDLLVGLDDEVLTSSSLVVQRDADRFAGARAEDRRRVLAAAAGLGLYDELAEASRERVREKQAALDLLMAQDAQVATQAEDLPRVESSRSGLLADRGLIALELADAVTALEAAQRDYDAAATAAREAEQAAARLRALERDLEAIDLDAGALAEKLRKARATSARAGEIRAAAAALQQVRDDIAELERDQARHVEQYRAHSAGAAELARMTRALAELRETRLRTVARIDQQIEEAERQATRLEDAACPVIERIQSSELAACTFLRDAKGDADRLPALRADLEEKTETSPEELAVVERIQAFTYPDPPDTEATRIRLEERRARGREILPLALLEPQIAAAEQFIVDETPALARLNDRREAKRQDLAAAQAASRPAVNLGEAAQRRDTAREDHARLERKDRELAEAIARLDGRLEELQAAARAHERLAGEIAEAQRDVAAHRELATAWKVARVQVLENDVIPGVEAIANRVLAFFPYGIQLAFETQRETKTTDRLIETLDIRIVGDRAEYYEGLSGGQRTAVDFATHVGIAIVVAQRAATRLHLLFVDEPEGLDDLGRPAFARTVRWIHDEYGIPVFCASHHADVVEHVDRTLVVEDRGEEGSAVHWADQTEGA